VQPDYKKNALRVKRLSHLWVTVIWFMMLIMSQFVISNIVFIGIIFIPIILLMLYLKFRSRLTFLYHMIWSIYTGVLTSLILQGNQISLLPKGYFICWIYSLILIQITYFIFSIGLNKNDVKKMILILGIQLISWLFIVCIAIAITDDVFFDGLVSIGYYSGVGWLISSPYVIAIGLSYQPKWFYRSALNAPFFIPLYLIVSLILNVLTMSGFMSWRDFLDLSIKDKRID